MKGNGYRHTSLACSFWQIVRRPQAKRVTFRLPARWLQKSSEKFRVLVSAGPGGKPGAPGQGGNPGQAGPGGQVVRKLGPIAEAAIQAARALQVQEALLALPGRRV